MSAMDKNSSSFLLTATFITTVLVFPIFCSPCEVVIVDMLNGSNCSLDKTFYPRFENRTCNSLEDVFSLIENEYSITNESAECFEVRVGPGTHTVHKSFVFTKGIKLMAEHNLNATVLLNVPYSEQPSQKPDEYHYALSFHNVTNEVTLDSIDFINSSGIISFQNVTTVSIKNCSFRCFRQSAVDIYNCPRVFVLGSTFEQNGPVLFVKEQAFSGYACGLSVSYTDDMMTTHLNFITEVLDCIFRNNLNILPKELVQSTNQVITNSQFTGRGGGCALIVAVSRSLDIHFDNVLFADNEAQSYGGALYIALYGRDTHSVTLNQLVFRNNSCPLGAGGLEITFFESDAVNTIFVNVTNCEFIMNRADFGGGVCLSFPGSIRPGVFHPYLVRFENSSFISNIASQYGAALGIMVLAIFESRAGIQPVVISECNFSDNVCSNGGTLSTAYMPLKLDGHNTFNNNSGRAIVNIGSLVKVHGKVEFLGNNAVSVDGGALFSASLGQFQLYQGANINFKHNQGLLGSAVIVQNEDFIPDVFADLWFNPLCFLLYEDNKVPPDLWENVSITFSANKAMVASAAYITDISTCSWSGAVSPYFDLTQVMRWKFVNFTNDNQNTAYAPFDYEPDWYVQTPAVDLLINDANITVYPGEIFQVGLRVLDEVGRATASIVRISEVDDLSRFNVRPSLDTLDYIFDGQSLINVSATIPKIPVVGASSTVSVESVINHKVSAMPKGLFNLKFVGCPAGYILVEEHGFTSHLTCACNEENIDIVMCQGTNIMLSREVWATQAVTLQEVASRLHDGFQLVTYPCPPGYCRCTLVQYQESATTCKYVYDGSQQDSQCHCDREGILCGRCRNDTGVSVLLNNCVSCSDVFWLLIVILVLVDLVLFIGFFWFVKHFLTWIYPGLFYIQILPYLSEHFPWTFEHVRPYLYYVSSGLSFYFPYDLCLNRVSPLASYTLRYLPFFLAVIAIGVLLTIKYFIKKPRKPWNGLWWIVLMMYTHVIHTCVSVLNCPALPVGSSQDSSPRWYVDGSVTCFHGWHAVLGSLAVIILLVSVAVIPILAVYTCNCVKRPRWLSNLGVALRKHFKKRYVWWSSVELARRMLMVLLVVPFPGNEYPAIFLLCVMITVYGVCQPYRDTLSMIIEITLSLSVLVLLLLKNSLEHFDDFHVIQGSLESHISNQSNCSAPTGLSYLTWMLVPFYYLPLVLLLCIIVGCTAHYIWKTVWKSKQTRGKEEDGGIEMSANTSQVTVTTTVVDLNDLESEEPVSSRQRAKTENVQSSNNDSKLQEHTKNLRSGGRVFSNNVAMDRLHVSRLNHIKQVFSTIAAGLNSLEESDEM